MVCWQGGTVQHLRAWRSCASAASTGAPLRSQSLQVTGTIVLPCASRKLGTWPRQCSNWQHPLMPCNGWRHRGCMPAHLANQPLLPQPPLVLLQRLPQRDAAVHPASGTHRGIPVWQAWGRRGTLMSALRSHPHVLRDACELCAEGCEHWVLVRLHGRGGGARGQGEASCLKWAAACPARGAAAGEHPC